MKTVLFLCVENACRSQMAEGFAKRLGAGRIEAYSAGSRPSGRVNEKATAAMKALGYDLSEHRSKGLDGLRHKEFDLVITMGCGDVCPTISAKKKIAWAIPDPKAMPMDAFCAVRDRIREKVNDLIASLERAPKSQ